MSEFDWMVNVSNRCDKTIRKVNNCLRNQSLEDLMFDTEKRINQKYQRLYNRTIDGVYDEPTFSQLKSLEESKTKWNLMVTIYDMEWEEKPWYVRLIKKKRKYKKYE